MLQNPFFKDSRPSTVKSLGMETNDTLRPHQRKGPAQIAVILAIASLLLTWSDGAVHAGPEPGFVILDRYVDSTFAVLLVGPHEEERIVPIEQVAQGLPPGTWLHYDGAVLVPDERATATARARILQKLDRLKARARASGTIHDGESSGD